jgi:hypothetical protein
MQLTGQLKELFFCQLPLLENYIQIALNLSSPWKATIANPQPSEFCVVVIIGLFLEETLNDFAIAPLLWMLLIFVFCR